MVRELVRGAGGASGITKEAIDGIMKHLKDVGLR